VSSGACARNLFLPPGMGLTDADDPARTARDMIWTASNSWQLHAVSRHTDRDRAKGIVNDDVRPTILAHDVRNVRVEPQFRVAGSGAGGGAAAKTIGAHGDGIFIFIGQKSGGMTARRPDDRGCVIRID
jgi:hypothetical protein